MRFKSMSDSWLLGLALKTLRGVVGYSTSDEQGLLYCTDILYELCTRHNAMNELTQLDQEILDEDYHQESVVELGPQQPKPKVNYNGS